MHRRINSAITGLFLSLASVLLTGCGGGGGGLSFLGLGSLFSGFGSGFFGGGGEGLLASLSGTEEIALATIHNPEPATLLLLGSGMAAMAYFKNKKRT